MTPTAEQLYGTGIVDQAMWSLQQASEPPSPLLSIFVPKGQTETAQPEPIHGLYKVVPSWELGQSAASEGATAHFWRALRFNLENAFLCGSRRRATFFSAGRFDLDIAVSVMFEAGDYQEALLHYWKRCAENTALEGFDLRGDAKWFVELNPTVKRLLGQSWRYLSASFPDASFRSSVERDPEDLDVSLVVWISPRGTLAEAVQARNAFEDAWWLDHISQACGKLWFHLDV